MGTGGHLHMATPESAAGRYDLEREGSLLRIRLSGSWTLAGGIPAADAAVAALRQDPPVRRLVLEARALGDWDSALPAFVHGLASDAAAQGVELDPGGLPEGARRLVELARAVPAMSERPSAPDDAVLARVGRMALGVAATAGDALTFLGEVTLALASLFRGRARFRRLDLLLVFEATGVAALGIVALINFLVGAVLAFVGAIQLIQFGAGIYVANLVAIGITRELAPLMTGIVMSGRTGAAFAAMLGTMTVNEEVDALRTMGLRPTEFLVLPRTLATALMMPALVAYADFVGLLGGALVGVAVLGLGPTEYFHQTQDALAFRHVAIGLGKSVVFGGIVALTGCYYGIRCGRSAAAVGAATTRAVVMGILLIVVADAVSTVILYMLQM
jgi:phospholipid/cholesterol/gamma-HCH transport system permease protein